MRRTAIHVATLLLAAASAAAALAQDRGAQEFREQLFPPEVVMQFQRQIGLSPEQRKSITAAIGKAQAKLLDLQWTMEEEAQQLSQLLQASPVNEAAALAQVDRVLAIEREVKRQHLSLLIQIKNVLTTEQQSRLRALRGPDEAKRP